MKSLRSYGVAAIATALLSGACSGQTGSDLVVSSDPELGELAARLLPDLASRAGLELTDPVRVESRSREELVRYLESKLDEELPPEEARARVDAYALLGLVEPDLELRPLLLGLYTEQVAGFYEPDSTALFVLDDQPDEALEALLLHELVHAIQDQNTDLHALTDPELGSDRATAAQAVIEGHATLVMLEFMYERMTGAPVDLGQVPDFGAQIRPAIEAMNSQFPALAGAPRVVRESLLFPYLEGAGFVQRLWANGTRVAPFGAALPKSTEQILESSDAGDPLELRLTVEGGSIVHEDVLGRFELGVLVEDVIGGPNSLADGWDGDRYALIESGDGTRSLAAYILWEGAGQRDQFLDLARASASSFGGALNVQARELGGRAAAVLRIGNGDGVEISAEIVPSR